MRTQVDVVEALCEELLRLAGVPSAAAASQAELLVAAEARGIRSHGLLRLPRLMTRLRNGTASPTCRGTHRWNGASYLAVDGGQGLGPVVALSALDALVPAATRHGIACAAITNSNHLGMLGWYTERVASAGLVCLAVTTSEALVHPWCGTEAMLGTNPISIGVPATPRPLVLDMATSEVSMGKIHEYAARGQDLEPGWALDGNGNPTVTAALGMTGAIAPFGGAKGYALGLALGTMVSAVTGCASGKAVTGTLDDTSPCNKGDLFIVIRGLGRSVSGYLDEVRASRPADPDRSVLVPGDGAQQRLEASLRDGMEIADDLWERLVAIRRELVGHASADR